MISKLLYRTPLAWLQLMKEKGRLAVAVAGITFANMLIFIQLGFQDALYDGAIKPHRLLQADLVLINPQFQSLISVQSFPRARLYQTLSYEEIESVSSVYIAPGQWKNPHTRQSRAILVWGVDPEKPAFALPEVNQLDQLKSLNQVLFDRASRPEYGPISNDFDQQGPLLAEVNRRTVQVVGIFTLGASFAADGNVITSDSTFLTLFPERKPELVDVGLIDLKPGVDPEVARVRLMIGLPQDVKVLTPESFATIEKQYWESGGAIGFIFGLGVLVGIIVGIVIVYQILYTDVVNHLPEYATLKAMGYNDRYLLGVLLQEALLLAVLGYIPGFALSLGLYQVAYAATLMPIAMKLERAGFVLALTLMMCFISGAIALRKLRTADPTDVF